MKKVGVKKVGVMIPQVMLDKGIKVTRKDFHEVEVVTLENFSNRKLLGDIGHLTEAMPYAVSHMDLFSYFDTVMSHADGLSWDGSEIIHGIEYYAVKKNSLYAFVKLEEIASPNVIAEEIINVPNLLRDNSGHWDDCNKFHVNPSKDAVKFSFRSQGWGGDDKHAWYYIEDRILICPDLTHFEESCVILKSIIDICKEKYGLTRLERAADKADSIPKKIKITLGCDPEFEYVRFRDDSITDNIPVEILSKKARTHNGEECSEKCEIGLDGSHAQIEIRPRPGKNPRRLIRNITKIMRKLKEVNLSVKGDVYPLGCHIHVGVGGPWTPDFTLLKMIDRFVGEPCYALNGQARGSYGALGAARYQPHGFEYRSLPGAIILDKKFFRIILKTVKNLTDLYINGGGKTHKYKYAPMHNIVDKADYVRLAGITSDEYEYFYDHVDKKERSGNVVAHWVRTANPVDIEEKYKKDKKRNIFEPILNSSSIGTVVTPEGYELSRIDSSHLRYHFIEEIYVDFRDSWELGTIDSVIDTLDNTYQDIFRERVDLLLRIEESRNHMRLSFFGLSSERSGLGSLVASRDTREEAIIGININRLEEQEREGMDRFSSMFLGIPAGFRMNEFDDVDRSVVLEQINNAFRAEIRRVFLDPPEVVVDPRVAPMPTPSAIAPDLAQVLREMNFGEIAFSPDSNVRTYTLDSLATLIPEEVIHDAPAPRRTPRRRS